MNNESNNFSYESQQRYDLQEEEYCNQPDLASLELGRKGEEAAARFLERHGYEIIERNWHCPVGEADIIALDDDCLVFVEVKTRSDINKGFPEEAVTKEKRERYECISSYYLRDADFVEMRYRFDVIGIIALGNNKASLRHHINAFGTE